MKRRFLLPALVLACAAGTACGGDGDGDGGDDVSNIDSSKKYRDLDSAELSQLCRYFEESFGGAGNYACGGVNVQIETQAQCEAAPPTQAPDYCTVGLLRACVSDAGGDPCNTLTSNECTMLLTCS